jgi:hypothetical protein
VAGFSKTPLSVYQTDITSQEVRVSDICLLLSFFTFPSSGAHNPALSTSNNLSVFMKVFLDVGVLSICVIEPFGDRDTLCTLCGTFVIFFQFSQQGETRTEI